MSDLFDDLLFTQLEKAGSPPHYDRGWRHYQDSQSHRVFEKAAEPCIKAPPREPGPPLTHAQRLWMEVKSGRTDKKFAVDLMFQQCAIGQIESMPEEMFLELVRFLSVLPIGESEAAWLEKHPLPISNLELHVCDFDFDKAILRQRTLAEELYPAVQARLKRDRAAQKTAE
jgi:hypothetical protein